VFQKLLVSHLDFDQKIQGTSLWLTIIVDEGLGNQLVYNSECDSSTILYVKTPEQEAKLKVTSMMYFPQNTANSIIHVLQYTGIIGMPSDIYIYIQICSRVGKSVVQRHHHKLIVLSLP
jgi:hypothetical protein